ncbi:hypothetical protein [Paraburkholderia terricola]|uniref:HipA-like C-terminal domain-containing protein n=1 Tax=Paraburkholderia terricola TaxID=169427 RepID=A0ABU1LTR3_9BURK|nr:hypothetical protein [Paraburkholderia terricola]MDR6410157.1 hypothetical protein [Paraburkholderia terricola]MDR6481317.1 hypothetical protein [Paraburkholderia terricola]
MPVPILSSSAWREFRGVPSSAGANPTTHLASVADVTGMLHNCYVKLLKPNTPALLCEAIGWVLANPVDVPVTSFGAIVLVPLDQLRNCMPLPSWTDGQSVCAAWCTEIVAGKSVRQVHKWAFWLARQKCLRSKDVRSIAAFDVWTDNRDRNFGNVIRTPTGGYIAIDHETLLHDLLWLPTGTSYARRSLVDAAKQHLSSNDLKQFNVELAGASSKHGSGLAIVQGQLNAFIDRLYPKAAPALSKTVTGYLNLRSQAGWLANEIGVIA